MRVDVCQGQMGGFGESHARGIEGREKRAMFEIGGALDQPVDVVSAEYSGEGFMAFTIRNHSDGPRNLDRVCVEKP